MVNDGDDWLFPPKSRRSDRLPALEDLENARVMAERERHAFLEPLRVLLEDGVLRVDGGVALRSDGKTSSEYDSGRESGEEAEMGEGDDEVDVSELLG